MRVLLDTSVFLHLAVAPERLSQQQLEAIGEAESRHLSVASAWEIAVKVGIGKLPLPGRTAEYVKQRLKQLHAKLLPIELAHVDRVQDLPNHHRDPFDRLIVAQALSENLTIVSLDQKLGAYGVSII